VLEEAGQPVLLAGIPNIVLPDNISSGRRTGPLGSVGGGHTRYRPGSTCSRTAQVGSRSRRSCGRSYARNMKGRRTISRSGTFSRTSGIAGRSWTFSVQRRCGGGCNRAESKKRAKGWGRKTRTPGDKRRGSSGLGHICFVLSFSLSLFLFFVRLSAG
jgi:hypothetical protein